MKPGALKHVGGCVEEAAINKLPLLMNEKREMYLGTINLSQKAYLIFFNPCLNTRDKCKR